VISNKAWHCSALSSRKKGGALCMSPHDQNTCGWSLSCGKCQSSMHNLGPATPDHPTLAPRRESCSPYCCSVLALVGNASQMCTLYRKLSVNIAQLRNQYAMLTAQTGQRYKCWEVIPVLISPLSIWHLGPPTFVRNKHLFVCGHPLYV